MAFRTPSAFAALLAHGHDKDLRSRCEAAEATVKQLQSYIGDLANPSQMESVRLENESLRQEQTLLQTRVDVLERILALQEQEVARGSAGGQDLLEMFVIIYY